MIFIDIRFMVYIAETVLLYYPFVFQLFLHYLFHWYSQEKSREVSGDLPSEKVKLAMKNGPVESSWVFPDIKWRILPVRYAFTRW